jgi:hypothetical protein
MGQAVLRNSMVVPRDTGTQLANNVSNEFAEQVDKD